MTPDVSPNTFAPVVPIAAHWSRGLPDNAIAFTGLN
jgi:hypothetical protein